MLFPREDRQESEEHWASLLSASSAEAIAQLYDHFAPLLFGIYRCQTTDTSEAEGLLQQCFINLYRHAQGYDSSRERVFTWMLRTGGLLHTTLVTGRVSDPKSVQP